MKLYFSPLACSLASRIALYEAGAHASFVHVDGKTKQTEDGRDYRQVHPLGLVPALELEPGELLTESAAILQLIGERYPQARLVPSEASERAGLHQWLSFIGTELHKALYVPLLDQTAAPEVKQYALAKAASRLERVAARLSEHEYLLDAFSVADAYLFAVLNWSSVTPVSLQPWPAIRGYQARLLQRPSIARAFADERALYAQEMARQR